MGRCLDVEGKCVAMTTEDLKSPHTNSLFAWALQLANQHSSIGNHQSMAPVRG